MHYILEDGEVKKVDFMTYAKWMGDRGNIIIAKTKIKGMEVSTVFLGLDMNWRDSPPVVFETMIFSNRTEVSEILGFSYHPALFNNYQERYCTLIEAEAGHLIACEMVKASKKNREPRKTKKLRKKNESI